MGVALSSSRETFYKIWRFGGRKDSGTTIKNNILVLKNKKKEKIHDFGGTCQLFILLFFEKSCMSLYGLVGVK